jgi:hypothetical protein
MSMTMEESMRYRGTRVSELFEKANAALFELHRHIETEHKDEAWRGVYGMRVELSNVEKRIQFRHFIKPLATTAYTLGRAHTCAKCEHSNIPCSEPIEGDPIV